MESRAATASPIEAVIELVHERLGGADATLAAEFVRSYLGGLAPSQRVSRDPADLYGAAISHFNLGASCPAGSYKVRVYSPQIDRHGWQSRHSIIDVVTPDMPFIVDSLRMSLRARGIRTHLLLHPVLVAQRDEEGRLTHLDALTADVAGSRRELYLHLEVDRIADQGTAAAIKSEIEGVLDAVATVVADWSQMKTRLQEAASSLRATESGQPHDEAIEFLEWLCRNNFTFLGFSEFAQSTGAAPTPGVRTPGGTLGILREDASRQPIDVPVELVRSNDTLIVTKGNARSFIHREGYYDCIAVKQLDAAGQVRATCVFIGLFASTLYNCSVTTVPLIRARVSRVLAQSPYPANSHGRNALLNLLEIYPRDELFHVDDDSLLTAITEMLQAQEHERVALFVHREPYARYYSCLVLVPRDRMSTQLRDRIRGVLEQAFTTTTSEYQVDVSQSRLARVHFVLRVDSRDSENRPDIEALTAAVQAAARAWDDAFTENVLETFGDTSGPDLVRRYAAAFRADYQERYSPRVAVRDIEQLELIGTTGALGVTLYRPLEAPANVVKLRLFHPGAPIPLSNVVAMLENMGLCVDESHPSCVEPTGVEAIWIHDLLLTHDEGPSFDVDAVAAPFKEALLRIWRADVENDSFNHLVIRAGLGWREVVILRTYARYLKQTGSTFSQDYIRQTLCSNPTIARLLIDLFHSSLSPEHANVEIALALKDEIRLALEAVESLDEDRILRSIAAVIGATLRTNFYQMDERGAHKPTLSVKLDPRQIPDLPSPKPRFEIFVYSPRVEGVHLRGGSISRGGLRWSDRPEDFRTEILGLLKAQTIKNSVIVPLGAKGGFVPKRLDEAADRAQEALACYRLFVGALLDITDNIEGARVVPPPGVVRLDRDDPYLVVAADKGTATFSDVANGIAAQHGFWLGDAFASGGSRGYDHKAMGITARGAWESVKRHFRSLGVDTQSALFTVVGIGDMAGDVFGNGMLLSPEIRLVAAFNHAHIFLDPTPNAEASFLERKRLFELPRSAWSDYDASVVSEGGGVYARTAKSIVLSPQAREALAIDREKLTPNELIRAILKAPVDLLWNGGIGTYVKSASETNADVGDRANDAVRVNGAELRCRVVGEGGNLGFTQRGRIEYAARGGLVNTDSIDNSAGVDCSDHEVNIKILLNQLVADGELTTKQRNELLAEMTAEVATLVLATNYTQTQALALAAHQAAPMLYVHGRLLAELEASGRIDRIIDTFPSDEEIEERRRQGLGLTRPELSVLIGHVKLTLVDEVLKSGLADEPYFVGELTSYFPSVLRERFRGPIARHRLAREIITNVVVNEVVNRAGMTFVFRMQEETGASASDIVRAYFAARDVFAQRDTWTSIESLDNIASAQAQIELLLESRKLVERAARWILRNRAADGEIQTLTDDFSAGIRTLGDSLVSVVDDQSRAAVQARADRLESPGVPRALATRVAGLEELACGFDIVEIAKLTGSPIDEAAGCYFELGAALDLHWFRDRANQLPRQNRWQALARTALREDLGARHRQLAATVLCASDRGAAPARRVAYWLDNQSARAQRSIAFIRSLKNEPSIDHAMLAAAMREVRNICDVQAHFTTEIEAPWEEPLPSGIHAA